MKTRIKNLTIPLLVVIVTSFAMAQYERHVIDKAFEEGMERQLNLSKTHLGNLYDKVIEKHTQNIELEAKAEISRLSQLCEKYDGNLIHNVVDREWECFTPEGTYEWKNDRFEMVKTLP